jgi:3alpha(or 20beta)-hydroxysteroid dehydrogenase
MSFVNKIVLITGASSGIGKETARAFAEEGAKLALVSRKLDDLEKTAQDLKLKEGDYLLLPANVTNEEQVQNFVQKTKDTFGRIDVFFNNAGTGGPVGFLLDFPAEDFDLVLDTNFKGAFWGLKYVLQVMVEQKSGAIINHSSIGGLKGMPRASVYNATKHAVIGLTKTAAVEYGPHGIRVNAICSSKINTRMMQRMMHDMEKMISPDNLEAAKEAFRQSVPLRRFGEPREVADAVVFLASDKASYISGVALPIDGGQMA